MPTFYYKEDSVEFVTPKPVHDFVHKMFQYPSHHLEYIWTKWLWCLHKSILNEGFESMGIIPIVIGNSLDTKELLVALFQNYRKYCVEYTGDWKNSKSATMIQTMSYFQTREKYIHLLKNPDVKKITAWTMHGIYNSADNFIRTYEKPYDEHVNHMFIITSEKSCKTKLPPIYPDMTVECDLNSGVSIAKDTIRKLLDSVKDAMYTEALFKQCDPVLQVPYQQQQHIWMPKELTPAMFIAACSVDEIYALSKHDNVLGTKYRKWCARHCLCDGSIEYVANKDLSLVYEALRSKIEEVKHLFPTEAVKKKTKIRAEYFINILSTGEVHPKIYPTYADAAADVIWPENFTAVGVKQSHRCTVEI